MRKNTSFLNCLTLALGVAVLQEVSFSPRTLAYNFNYGISESQIFNTDFDSPQDWSLKGTVIESGVLKAQSGWATASYSLTTPINLSQGNTFLYWSGIFPRDLSSPNYNLELDKYYLGLQYADNPVDVISGVDENAELKIEVRPLARNAGEANRYHRLYIDPDFDSQYNYSPRSTRLNVPSYRAGIPIDFRMEITPSYEAILYFWNGNVWQQLQAKSGYTSPLIIPPSDWIDARRKTQSPAPYENPVSFEAINVQFRQGDSTLLRHSAITAMALTQVLSVPAARFSILENNSEVQIPESSSVSGILCSGALIVGSFLKTKKRQSF